MADLRWIALIVLKKSKKFEKTFSPLLILLPSLILLMILSPRMLVANEPVEDEAEILMFKIDKWMTRESKIQFQKWFLRWKKKSIFRFK